MSVNSVDSQQRLPDLQPMRRPQSEFWIERSMQNRYGGLDGGQAQRVALRILVILTSGAGIGLVSLAVAGSIVPQMALYAIPCVLLASGTFWYSSSLHDYENPEELGRFRTEAARMSLESVVSAHGWKNVLRWGILPPELFATKFRQHLRDKNLTEVVDYYENTTRQIAEAPFVRYDYQLPNPREYRVRWRAETATLTFEEIIQRYSLDRLERYGIVESNEMHSIKDLKRNYEGIQGNYMRRVAQIDREFVTNTESFRRTYDTEVAAAHQLYNENRAVVEIPRIELRYVREVQAVHDVANRRRLEAQERYNRCILPITNNGQIPYQRLSPREQGIYNQKSIELEVARGNADNEARQQVANIDGRYITERRSLNVEEDRVRRIRNQILQEAQSKYERDIIPYNQRRLEALRPIEAAFRNSVTDINGHYRAYLRTIH